MATQDNHKTLATVSYLSHYKLRRAAKTVSSFFAANSNPLSRSEIGALKAMISFVACDQNVNASTVQDLVQVKFGIDTYASLQRKDYDTAIRFLVNLKIGTLLN